MKGKIKYFGTDGIRQKAEAFTPGFIQAVTLGIVRYLGNAKEDESGLERPARVLIGGDTRESTEWMIRYFEEALETVGIDHGTVGVLPTPAINYAFYEMGYDLAIDITASHNPYTDNGIKIFERGDTIGGLEATMPGGVAFSGTGTNDSGENLSHLVKKYPYGIKLSQSGVNAIENALENESGFDTHSPEFREDLHGDALSRYLDHLRTYLAQFGPATTSVRQKPDFSGLRIGLDLACGATSVTAKQIFEELGAEVIAIHEDANFGEKINAGCGSTHLESLIQLVKEKQLDFGAAFDGDGDRCLMIDHDGQIIDGDDMIVILANYLGIPEVCVTIMANKGLLRWAEKTGIKIAMTDVGDQNVSAKMREDGILLGGEQSGHIILPGEPMGDGVLTALVITKILSEARDKFNHEDTLLTNYQTIQDEKNGQTSENSERTLPTLSTLCQNFQKLPQTIKNQPVDSQTKQAFRNLSETAQQFITTETENLPAGWSINIRASGTEDLVRITIWGDDAEAIQKTADAIAERLTKTVFE